MSTSGFPYSVEGRMRALKARLAKAREGWLRARLGRGIFWTWGLTAFVVLLLALLATFYEFPVRGFSLLMWILLLAAVGATIWVVVRALRAWPKVLEFALRAGQEDPRVGKRVLTGLELWEKRRSRREGYSPVLIGAVVEETCRVASDIDFERMVPAGPARRAGAVLAAALAVWAILGILVPQVPGTAWRGLPVVFQGETVPRLEVHPGDCEVPPGEPLEIQATLYSPGVTEAALLQDGGGRGWRTLSMVADAEGESADRSVFHRVLPKVERPFRYSVISGRAHSDTFHVGVRARPKVVRIRVDYDYPDYTGLPNRTGIEGDGGITAVKGTRALVHLEASRDLSRAEFAVGGGDTVYGEIQDDPRRAVGTIKVMGDGQYVVRVVDTEEYGPDRPDVYPIVSLPDEVPLVRLDSPPREETLPPEMMVALRGTAHDDYGFSKILLRFFRSEGDEGEAARISGPVRAKEYDIEYAWNVGDLGLMPGDVLTYYLEVWDNDAVSGPKRAASEPHALRFPTVQEIFARASGVEEEKIEELRDVYEEEEFLKDRLKEISQDLRQEDEMSWEAKKEIEQAAKKQEEINERLEDIASGLEEATEMLEENELLSMEIFEKMAELRRLLEEIATPEMREAMKRLQDAMSQLSEEEIREALEEFEISQEELLERLERSIELLERLRIEKNMEELARVAEDLADRQAELARETAETPSDSLPDLARLEEAISRETGALEERISEAAEESRRLEPEASDALGEIARSMQEDEVVQRLEAAKNALSEGDPSESRSGTRRGAKDLEQIAQQLRLAQNSLSMEKRRKLAEAIERLTHDLVWFSFEEESIADQVGNLKTRDLEARRDVAQRQLELRTSASRLLQRLRQLMRLTFMISPEAGRSLDDALGHMEAAARILEDGRISPADKEGLKAMALINRSVMALMESKQCMSSCSSPMGLNEMLQQMQSMSCKQSGINQGTQQLLSQMGRRGLSMEARSQMARLAAEQRAVQKAAETLAGEMGDQGQILGRMEGMISEMERVVQDLESTGLSAETVERQKRILSRLLDAQKSVRRRDYARVRLSRVGEDVQVISPAELPDHMRLSPTEIREDLLKAAGETYPLRYEALIRSYFRSLVREGVEESSSGRVR